MHHWIVYKYTFPNNKVYIGATRRSLAARQGSYESGWIRYKGCKALWPAIQEFGVYSIQQEILFEGDCEDKEAARLEQFYIAQFNANDPEYGYNTYSGGEGLSKRNISEDTRKKLQDQMEHLHQLQVGRKASDSTRQKQSLAKKGKSRGPLSEEAKKKISIANSRENMSEETRIRRSLSKQKAIMAYNPATGERLIFNSHHDAAEYFGVRDSAVTRWLSATRNPSNGFTFSRYSPTTTE